MIEHLFDAAVLARHPGATLVYDDTFTGTRVWRVRDGDLDAAIKHTRYEGFRRRIRWRLRGSPGECEFDAARAIADAGIPTAEPIAFRQHSRLGLPSESWLAVRWIADAPSVYRQPGGPMMRAAVAEFVARLFTAGVYPADLTPGNLLARAANAGSRAAGGATQFNLFLIDQVEVARDQPMDAARMAKLIGRFALRASCPDCWGPWAATKWLAAVIARTGGSVRQRRRLLRQAVSQARARQARIGRRYVEDEAASPLRPRVRKEVLSPADLPGIVEQWRRSHASSPTADWRTIRHGERDWLVFATSPRHAAETWIRLMVMWNLFVPGPRPGAWVVEPDASLVIAQPIAGMRLADAFAQATGAARHSLIWQLSRLVVRLRRAGASIAPEHAGRMIVAGPASIGFDRDVPIDFGPPAPLDAWRDTLVEHGIASAGGDDFARQFTRAIRKASRLSRWSVA